MCIRYFIAVVAYQSTSGNMLYLVYQWKQGKQDPLSQGLNPYLLLGRWILHHWVTWEAQRVARYKQDTLEKETDNPLWYSCLENSMTRGTWQDTVHGVSELDTMDTHKQDHIWSLDLMSLTIERSCSDQIQWGFLT